MQIVGYINTNKDYLHGQKMKLIKKVINPGGIPVHYNTQKAAFTLRQITTVPMWSSDIALLSFNRDKKRRVLTPRSGLLAPEQTQYPLYLRQGGLHGRCGPMCKMLFAPGFEPRSIPVRGRFKTYCTETLKRISTKWTLMREFVSGLNLCSFRHMRNKICRTCYCSNSKSAGMKL